MKFIGPRASLVAALALIVISNAIVLGGIVYNRAGKAESVLQLSERELEVPHAWGLAEEKSAIALELAWRVIPPQEERTDGREQGFSQHWRTAGWLTQDKLRELGFDLPAADALALNDAMRRRDREKEVYLVMELGGESYQQAVRAAQQHLARVEARNKGQASDAERLSQARIAVQRELSSNTRLFVIDAGLDPKALRVRYPDRTRYAVIAGRIKPWLGGAEGKRKIWGYVSALGIERISVPYDLRPTLGGFTPTRNYGESVQLPRFEATVAYGQRLEPWILSAKRLSGGEENPEQGGRSASPR